MIPTEKSFGFVITLLKSWIVSPSPRPNMINANAMGAMFVTISMTPLHNSMTTVIYFRSRKLQEDLEFYE